MLLLSLNNGGPQGGSGTQYFVGDRDGSSFTLDAEFEEKLKRDNVVWFDHGADNYAGVTWNGAPDGRRIFMDRTSVELFADDGATVMTNTFYPSEDYTIGEIRWSEDTRLNNAGAWRLAERGTPAK